MSLFPCNVARPFADINNIYVLNGNSEDKVKFDFKSIYKDAIKWRGCACFNDGKYYLSARINYADDVSQNYDIEKNNCLIVYDLDSDEFEVCVGLSILKMEVYYDESQSRVAILSGGNRAYKLKTLSRSGVFNGNIISKKI